MTKEKKKKQCEHCNAPLKRPDTPICWACGKHPIKECGLINCHYCDQILEGPWPACETHLELHITAHKLDKISASIGSLKNGMKQISEQLKALRHKNP